MSELKQTDLSKRLRAKATQPEATKPAQDLSGDTRAGKIVDYIYDRCGFVHRDMLVADVASMLAALASPADALVAGDRVDAITDAARSVLREALDAAEVHPCDTNNDSARAKQLSPLMQNLYRAIQAQKDGHGHD